MMFALLLIAAATSAAAPVPSAEDLLARTIAYHDPQGAWGSREIAITTKVRLAERLASERGYSERTDHVVVNNAAGTFRLSSEKAGDRIEILGDGETFRARLNGSFEIDDEDREKHRLGAEQLPGWRNYFVYMLGLPMKLRDPGTLLDSTVKHVEFAGRQALALRVTYTADVGGDIWYFYVDPQTFALVGCRFFHDEAANDGEYLTFEGELSGSHGLRLPKLRRWYMNKDGEHIADDDLISLE